MRMAAGLDAEQRRIVLKKRNILLGLAYAVFALVGLIYTCSWSYTSTTGLNPGFWPTIMFALLLLSAVGIIVFSVIGADGDVKEEDKFKWNKSLPTIVWVGVYTFAFQQFGFLIPTMVFLFGEMFLFGEKRWKVLIPVSVVLPVVLSFLFTRLFGIYLP